MSTQEQANRTADIVLKYGVMRRREALLRKRHANEDGECLVCEMTYPCEVIEILDSVPPIVTEE